MIEAAFKAFARALRAAVDDRSDRDRRAVDQGDADRMIGIVDYGMGNRRSVEKALRARRRATLRDDRATTTCCAPADGLVLPGVGAFPEAMRRLRDGGFDDADRATARPSGVPVIGLCLGMQLLYEDSRGVRRTEGLGLLRGRVVPLRAAGLKLPHIGWHDGALRARDAR